MPGRRPVLLYSPGGGDARTMGSSLATDLASYGWTVITVDHPGDASEVEFPNERPGRDRIRTTVLRPDMDAATFRTMIATRVADLRFVLDTLGLDRVGVYGHSAGGTAAAQALHEDRRIAAAVNLEGYLDQMDGELLPVARQGTDRPLLLAGTDGFRDARLDRSWAALLAHSGPVTRPAARRHRALGLYRLCGPRPPAPHGRPDDRCRTRRHGRSGRPARHRARRAQPRKVVLRPSHASVSTSPPVEGWSAESDVRRTGPPQSAQPFFR
nr:alpha/beta fold hydrolase [Streptomyces sp. NBC_00974]